ncbi:MAG: DUF896 domain-containing protein [Eubacteriales bacterium]|nr:DUF896 domain-containing protein [Eubacteriales bacterium]
MEKNKIDRINTLARIKRERELSREEKEEQERLRKEYITEFHSQFRNVLNNTYIQRPDGTKEKIKPKEK